MYFYTNMQKILALIQQFTHSAPRLNLIIFLIIMNLIKTFMNFPDFSQFRSIIKAGQLEIQGLPFPAGTHEERPARQAI